MASADLEIKVSDEVLVQAFQKMGDELLAAKEALSEERIRAIIREELATWERQRLLELRTSGGIKR